MCSSDLGLHQWNTELAVQHPEGSRDVGGMTSLPPSQLPSTLINLDMLMMASCLLRRTALCGVHAGLVAGWCVCVGAGDGGGRMSVTGVRQAQ